MSSKCDKYMKQYEERNYAPKVRKIEKGDLKKYSNRGPCGIPCKAGCRDSLQQSREEQEEVMDIVPPKLPLCLRELVQTEFDWYQSQAGLPDITSTLPEDEETNIHNKGEEMRLGQKKPPQAPLKAKASTRSGNFPKEDTSSKVASDTKKQAKDAKPVTSLERLQEKKAIDIKNLGYKKASEEYDRRLDKAVKKHEDRGHIKKLKK